MIISKVRFVYTFSSFIIKRGWYLIPAPPEKPSSSAQRTVTLFQKQKKQNAVSKLAPEVSKQRQALVKQIKQDIEQYEKVIEEYNKKYIHPLRRYNLYSYLVQQWKLNPKNKEKNGNLAKIAPEIKKMTSELKKQEKETLLKKIQQINSKNISESEKYRIPVNTFETFENWLLKTTGVRKESLNKTTVTKYEKDYQNFLKAINAKQHEFAKNHNITNGLLEDLIKKQWQRINENRLNRKSQQESDQTSD